MAKRGLRFTTPEKGASPAKSWASWASPSLRSPSSSSSSQRLTYVGFILLIGPTRESKNKNKMFDVKFKTGNTDVATIRVMQAPMNSQIKKTMNEIRKSPVKVTCSRSDQMTFFNEGRGASIEVVKYSLDFDNTIPISKLTSNFEPGQIPFIEGEMRWVEDEARVVYTGTVQQLLVPASK